MASERLLHHASKYILLAFLVLTMFAAGYLTASSLGNAARTWIPGDLSYPLKTAQEEVTLLLTADPTRRADLHREYAHRRMQEVQALVFEDRLEYLPETARDFTSHLEQALWDLYSAAGDDPQSASRLAAQLESDLLKQEDMLRLLVGISPETTHAEFYRIIQVSRTGLIALRGLLVHDGALEIQG